MKKVILLFLIIFPLFAHGQISISNLNEATTINSSDLFLLTQGSSSKKLKYSTLRTNVLSTVIPWSDTLINGKMVSKYYLYNQLLTKINWSDTLSPNGKLFKFVENHGGAGSTDSSKLVTKYDLASGINTPSFSLYTPTYGTIWQATTAGFDLSSQSTSGSFASFMVRGGDINKAGMEFLLRGYQSTSNTDFSIEVDTSGMTFKNSTSQVAKIDSSGNVDIKGQYKINGTPISTLDSLKLVTKKNLYDGLVLPQAYILDNNGSSIGYITDGIASLGGSSSVEIESPLVTINSNNRNGELESQTHVYVFSTTHKIKGPGYDFVFYGDTLNGWRFHNNRTGQQLQIDTSLNVTTPGKIMSAGIYAGIYVTDGVTAQSIATGTTYTKMTCFATNGLSSNCTSDATNDKITITKAGKYYLNWNMSASAGTANVVWTFTAFLGGTELASPHSQRKITIAGDVGAFGGQGFINVTSVPVDLDLRVHHDNGGSVDITPVFANLTIQYVGE